MTTFLEREIIAIYANEMRGQGFEVVIEPSSKILPSFFEGYRPDVVGFSPNGNVALEVMTRRAASQQKLDKISRLFRDRKDWILRVVWREEVPEIHQKIAVGIEEIQEKIDSLQRILTDSDVQSIFLMTWSVLEAVARLADGAEFANQQTAHSLVQRLAHLGYIGPSDADTLRTLLHKRNKLAHGGIDERIEPASVLTMFEIISKVIDSIQGEIEAESPIH